MDLANRTLLSQSRISRQIDTLQVKGFLRRESTNADRRATYAVLTEAGKQIFTAADTLFVEAFRRRFLDLVPQNALGPMTEVMSNLALQDAGQTVSR